MAMMTILMIMMLALNAQAACLPSTDLLVEVQNRLQAFTQLHSAGNVTEMLDFHVEHILIMPPGLTPITNKQDLRVMLENLEYLNITYTTFSMERICGDSVISAMRYFAWKGEGDNTQSQQGTTLMLWKREYNEMKIHWEIWRPDNP